MLRQLHVLLGHQGVRFHHQSIVQIPTSQWSKVLSRLDGFAIFVRVVEQAIIVLVEHISSNGRKIGIETGQPRFSSILPLKCVKAEQFFALE
ncbi:hypothetical protein V6N13_027250 [Hibiscus sabdariffa]|uniref:Uncharacterized protein n=2 Tax=Hibiscus sabdariffa TaxID=183260 RepID=A0ABR2B4H3_9ROSI